MKVTPLLVLSIGGYLLDKYIGNIRYIGPFDPISGIKYDRTYSDRTRDNIFIVRDSLTRLTLGKDD
jgi:hypothetical protein